MFTWYDFCSALTSDLSRSALHKELMRTFRIRDLERKLGKRPTLDSIDFDGTSRANSLIPQVGLAIPLHPPTVTRCSCLQECFYKKEDDELNKILQQRRAIVEKN